MPHRSSDVSSNLRFFGVTMGWANGGAVFSSRTPLEGKASLLDLSAETEDRDTTFTETSRNGDGLTEDDISHSQSVAAALVQPT